MVEIDLRKLSAPVEALRPSLVEAYKRLDAKWEEIAEVLKGLPIPTDVSYTYAFDQGDASCLVWKKWNGKKRICVEYVTYNPHVNEYSDFDTETIPFEEWSGTDRIQMLEHVPGLFEAAAEATQKFIDKTKV